VQLTCIGRLSQQMFIIESHKQLLKHKWSYAYGLCVPPQSGKVIQKRQNVGGQLRGRAMNSTAGNRSGAKKFSTRRHFRHISLLFSWHNY